MSQAFDAGAIAGMEKVALAVTREGHKFDEELAAIRERALSEEAALAQRYGAMGSKGQKGSFLKALRGFTGDFTTGDPRNYAYRRRMHAEGRNPWNPLGGAMTPSKYEEGGTKGFYGKFKVPKHEDKKDDKK
jgi:hypothetical protein